MRNILLCCLLLCMVQATAQEKNTVKNGEFWGKSDAYLHKQAFQMFDLIDEALTENPPTIGAPMVRKLALYNLDAMLHETKYDNTEPFKQFVDSRMQKLLVELNNPVKKGLKIFKVYNDGFIARTQSTTIAFDIVRGYIQGKEIVSEEYIKQIVEHCDILFITHNHGDHADRLVADLFIEAGKPVIVPTNIWPDDKVIQHLRSDEIIDKEIALKNGKKLQVKILPGHQSELMNNIYVVTTEEKKTIVQTGDQYHKEDINWLMNIHQKITRPDALLVNCWTNRMNDLIEGFAPKFVITGHENEMGHTIDHREAFWLTFQKMEEIKRNYVVMGWGEWFLCK